MIASCPAGNVPKSGSYIEQTDSIRISFYRHQCEGCPYQYKCAPAIKERTASLLIPLKSRIWILESTELIDDDGSAMEWKQWHPFSEINTRWIKCREAEDKTILRL